MNIGVVGLGLIGGSIVKSAKRNTEYTIYGYDINEKVVSDAIKDKFLDGALTEDTIGVCVYVFNPLYPEKVIDFVEKNASSFKHGAVIIV